MRNWPIRRQIVAVLTLPMLVLTGLMTEISIIRLTEARAATVAGDGAQWLVSVNELIRALQAERVAAASLVGSGYLDRQYADAVADAVTQVDAARQRVDEATATLLLNDQELFAEAVGVAQREMQRLDAVRADLDAQRLDPLAVSQPYSDLITKWLAAEGLLSRAIVPTSVGAAAPEDLANVASALSAVAWANEYVSLQYTYVAAMLAPGDAADSAARVRAAIGSEEAWVTQFRLAAMPAQVQYYDQTVLPTVSNFSAVRDRVLRGEADTVTLADWAATGDRRQDALYALQSRLVTDLATMSADAVSWAQFRAYLALGLASFYIGGSILIAVLVGRRLVRSLRELRDGSLRVARQRLPEVSGSIRAGHVVDPDTEPPPFTSPSRNEIGDVAAATNELYQAAVRATYEVASVRSVGEVLRTLARRSLHLTRRQLKLITELERQEEDPRTVEQLFGIDHQATRMRRLAESLLVLAGEQPHRPNRVPMPLFDILRAAAAEVDDYTRIQIRPTGTDVRVAGRAVGDVTHLLAELLENAAAFSPAASMVEVRAGQIGQGWAIDIEDRGVGLDDESFARHNARLADPPPFEPESGGRIGLVVVARLAARHGVTVQLRRGIYQGVHAVVIMPKAILETSTAERDAGVPTILGATGPAPASVQIGGRAGRHALADHASVSTVAHSHPLERAVPGPRHAEPVMGQPASHVAGLARLPTRIRGAQMAEQLRSSRSSTGPDNGLPLFAPKPPESARQLAEGFMRGYARGQQASQQNGDHR